MSNKAIAWTLGIIFGIMFLYIGIAGFKSSVERPTTTYSTKCSWCGKNQRMPNKSVCKDCNELAEQLLKYNK